MTDEKLAFANELKKRIDKLDNEIYEILGIEPSVRSSGKFGLSGRGIFHKIRSNKLIISRSGLKEIEIELSNEDCRALIDIRTAEREVLKQVLKSLN